MSQDVNQDWNNREFNDSVEIAVRKCVDFLNNFQESAKYRLSVVDQRLTSLERKLDYMDAQLKNCDPSERVSSQMEKKMSSKVQYLTLIIVLPLYKRNKNVGKTLRMCILIK